MKKGILITMAFVLSFGAIAQVKTVVPAKANVAATKPVASKTNSISGFKNIKDSASYALGYRIAQSLKGQGLQDVNFEMFKKGMAAGVIAKTAIPDSLIDLCIKNYQDKMTQEKKDETIILTNVHLVLINALSFSVALGINDLVTTIFNSFPSSNNNIIKKLIYVVIMFSVTICAAFWLFKIKQTIK